VESAETNDAPQVEDMKITATTTRSHFAVLRACAMIPLCFARYASRSFRNVNSWLAVVRANGFESLRSINIWRHDRTNSLYTLPLDNQIRWTTPLKEGLSLVFVKFWFCLAGG
jgi:hypothetical protein